MGYDMERDGKRLRDELDEEFGDFVEQSARAGVQPCQGQ